MQKELPVHNHYRLADLFFPINDNIQDHLGYAPISHHSRRPTGHRSCRRATCSESRGSLLQRVAGTKRFVVGNNLVVLAGKTIGSAFRTARRHAVLQNVAAEIGEQCEIGIAQNSAVVFVDQDSVPIASILARPLFWALRIVSLPVAASHSETLVGSGASSSTVRPEVGSGEKPHIGKIRQPSYGLFMYVAEDDLLLLAMK